MAGLPHGEIIYEATEIDRRIEDVAYEAFDVYEALDPIWLTILDGGAQFSYKFMTALAKTARTRALEIAEKNGTEVEDYYHPVNKFIGISSYAEGREPKAPRLTQDLSSRVDLEGRLVVGLDDLTDDYGTANFLRSLVLSRGAAGFEFATLGRKEGGDPGPVIHRLNCFWFPRVWLTGMGMDDSDVAEEGNRSMDFIALAKNKDFLDDVARRNLERERVKLGLSPQVGGLVTRATTAIQQPSLFQLN